MARLTVLIDAGGFCADMEEAKDLLMSGRTPMTGYLRRRIDEVLGDATRCFTVEPEGDRLVAVPTDDFAALVATIRAQARR